MPGLQPFSLPYPTYAICARRHTTDGRLVSSAPEPSVLRVSLGAGRQRRLILRRVEARG